jgi:hypothetical protein
MLSHLAILKIGPMPHTIRTSLDIPEELHRRIHEAAKRRGCSARALILSSIEREVAFESRPRGRVQAPLVLDQGEPVNPSHDQIYDVLFS